MDTRIQQACEAAAAQWDVPALGVGIRVGGDIETAYAGCDGGTRFRIASVTKPMVALLVLSLLDPGEGTGGVWPPDVRVRHLLSHTSGFDCELPERDQRRFGDGDDALVRCVAELPDVRRLVGIDEIWSYANTGYWLAGFLAAARAGSSFEDALTERVLAPAGLEATSFAEPGLDGHGKDVEPPPYPRARRPSGGLASTVPDVLRFGGRLLEEPLFARMREVHGKPVGGVYGLGLFGERVAGVDVWGHTGSYGGFEASLLSVPDRGAIFVGLANAERGRRALRALEDRFFELAIGARRAVPVYEDADPGELAAWAGVYENGDGRYVVEPSGANLVIRHQDGAGVGRKIGPTTFAFATGEWAGNRFDFPREGFARFGSRLASRVG
jgi:CubicO group peptidase (beta-lactamase class C family)